MRNFRGIFAGTALAFAFSPAPNAQARSPDREVVSFSVTWDVGLGNNVHVVGGHPDVGNWSPVDSVKLRWTPGNVWTGRVAVQNGTELAYKFISRNSASNQYCNGANASWEPDPNRTNRIAAAPPPPFAGKTIFYYSGWSNVSVLYASGTNTNFLAAAMTNTGPGRNPGEFLHRVDGVGVAGASIQFVFTDGQGGFDKSPFPTGVGATGNDYLTPLDAFLVQDGQLYNYWPAATVAGPRQEIWSVGSTHPPIDGRNIVIVLPRGYDAHPWKHYPVVYFTDGQNITNGANVFGNGSWEADTIAHREAAGGRMREVILVGVYNYPERRRWEYNPLGDTYVSNNPGRADAYLQFLINNVRPTLDFNFRTLNDRRNTFAAGSSMGGIFSLYAGFETNVFGGVLAMSPALTRAPNYKAALASKPRQPMRVYLDTGTDEGQVGTLPGGYYWDDPWNAYDSLLAIGYVPNLDLLMRIGCGQGHNETAWRTRLPTAFRFLLDARDEPNRLAHDIQPPGFRGVSRQDGHLVLDHEALARHRYEVDAAPSPDGPWTPVATTAPISTAWAYPAATGSATAVSALLRLRAIPDP